MLRTQINESAPKTPKRLFLPLSIRWNRILLLSKRLFGVDSSIRFEILNNGRSSIKSLDR